MGEFRYIGTPKLTQLGMAAIYRAVTDCAEDLVGKAQAATPVDTGTLKASIHVDSVTGGGTPSVTAKVSTGGEASEYAIPVHEGWRPHWIIASSAGALYWPGAAHPVHAVMNPGHAGFRYLSHPLQAERATYRAFIAAAARGAF